MDTTIAGDDRILSEAELDHLTGISGTTRWRLRKEGRFPALIELSPGRKAHTAGQIRRWKEERLAAAEAAAARELRSPGRPRKSAA
jgi:predicted DNA-binding transcriptional regulator AlpA